VNSKQPADEHSPQRPPHRQPLDVDAHGAALRAILDAVRDLPDPSPEALSQLLRHYPRPDGGAFSKWQLLHGYREQCRRAGLAPDPEMIRRLQMKPTRTLSGVAPVAVLTAPHPCPGTCIFCPQVENLPRSYLHGEPGALRGIDHAFDPFDQVAGRIRTLRAVGHPVDKVELLILGGTWSAYPEDYQVWFVQRCLEGLNGDAEERGWGGARLETAQLCNETAPHRCVGLVVETRPDWVTPAEVHRLRWLGVTKVQLGVQSLDDAILARNCRGHDVAATRRAVRLLRLAGFKIVVHWMPNLLGATPESDLADFRRLWDDPALRPDELKIYPTALLADTVLYEYWQRGEYVPYDEGTLVHLLSDCKVLIPPYSRVNRLMRDIPAPQIVAGVRKSNLREVVRRAMRQEGRACRCLRCREIRGAAVDEGTLRLDRVEYATDATTEFLLQYVTPEDRVAGFLRLSLPRAEPPMEELVGCAVVREVHVYGPALELDAAQPGAAQHVGLGTRLLEEAGRLAREAGYGRLAVIAAVGTRPYYRTRGFVDGALYMEKRV
jgi:elongator complex protein 3